MDKNFEKDGVWLGLKQFPVWKDNTEMASHDGDTFVIESPELEPFKDPLVKKILEKDKEQRAQKPLNSLANGGMKVRDLDTFDISFFDLINARAKVFFKLVTGLKTAVIDDCWANVMYQGEWLIPHSHQRSSMSVVYSLDPGNGMEVSDEPLNGHLMFSDPRLPQCCPRADNYVQSFFRPIGDIPSAMVIFPSILTHMVAPYQGTRPRITIAWNINQQKVPGELVHVGENQQSK